MFVIEALRRKTDNCCVVERNCWPLGLGCEELLAKGDGGVYTGLGLGLLTLSLFQSLEPIFSPQKSARGHF